MIKINDIEKEIKNQNSLKVKDVSFKKGNIYSILGHNGSGKSTFLKLLYKVENFKSGRVDINNMGFSSEVVNKYIAYNPQKTSFLSGTLKDNFEYVYKYSENDDLLERKALEKLLIEFDLHKRLDTNIKKLSGGEQAKAQLIRTLMMNKDFNLFDEPMANMDVNTIKKVEKIMLELKNRGKTVILVTHDFYQAKRISDYIVFMENLSYIDTYKKEEFFRKYVF